MVHCHLLIYIIWNSTSFTSYIYWITNFIYLTSPLTIPISRIMYQYTHPAHMVDVEIRHLEVMHRYRLLQNLRPDLLQQYSISPARSSPGIRFHFPAERDRMGMAFSPFLLVCEIICINSNISHESLRNYCHSVMFFIMIIAYTMWYSDIVIKKFSPALTGEQAGRLSFPTVEIHYTCICRNI